MEGFLSSGAGSTDFGDSDIEDETPELKRLETELLQSSEDSGGQSLGGDLFSEIHLNELRKLEKKLEEVGGTGCLGGKLKKRLGSFIT